jgi:hypothetical protein
MNPNQIQSLVRSVLKLVGAILVTHGATAYAAILNTEDVAGLVVTLVGLYMSHEQHAPKPVDAVGGGVANRPPAPALTSCATNRPPVTETVNAVAGVSDIPHSALQTPDSIVPHS